jgi:hypothetical protein
MELIVNCVLASLAMLLGAIPLLLTARLKRRLPAMLAREADKGFRPKVSVILPCKGIDQGFAANVQSLLDQDYPALELLFVVATRDDPAFLELERLLANPLHRGRARLMVAGIGRTRAQKLTNQLAAVREASADSQVFVFIDSDCRPDPGFVQRLVSPLVRDGTGATTGYRWYHPPAPTLGSMLRSTWNAGALPFLVDPRTTHAWGGAMAIRREVFREARIAEVWDKAVSDDLTLTVAIHRLGLQLEFVPRCIAVSYEESSLAQTLEFTNRQSLISRVYFPPLWWSTAFGHASANLLIIYGIASLGAWASGASTAFLVGATCLLQVPLQLINAAWLFGSAKDLLPKGLHDEVEALRWRYVFTAPIASLMTLVNTVHAATTRRITWRGITYELVSAEKTVVVSGHQAPGPERSRRA